MKKNLYKNEILKWKKKQCAWGGSARLGRCADPYKIRKALEVDINTSFVKKYFKHNYGPVLIKATKTTRGKSPKIKKKKITKIIDKNIPKTDAQIQKFIDEGRENNDQALILDVPVNTTEFERGLKQNDVYEGTCKPLTLRFGTVECEDGFNKDSEW